MQTPSAATGIIFINILKVYIEFSSFSDNKEQKINYKIFRFLNFAALNKYLLCPLGNNAFETTTVV